MKKVLFLGGGRRVSLSDLFSKNDFEVYGYELNKQVPISKNTTIVVGKKWTDPEIKQHIQQIVYEKKIDLVIPLQDEGVVTCAELQEINSDCIYLSSNKYASNICYDKKEFEIYMTSNFNHIYPFPNKYPKICKPKFGFSSRGVFEIKNEEEEKSIPIENILQNKIIGKEYSVDAYFDKNSKFVDAVVRDRIRIAGGEVITSKTTYIESLYQYTKEIGEKLKLKGCTCFQYIIQENNPFIIEINARFGGGSVLSIYSGMDIIKLIKRDYFNEHFEYEPLSWKKNVLMERYYQETYFV